MALAVQLWDENEDAVYGLRDWFSLLPVLWGMYICVETLSYVISIAVVLLVISSYNKTN